MQQFMVECMFFIVPTAYTVLVWTIGYGMGLTDGNKSNETQHL